MMYGLSDADREALKTLFEQFPQIKEVVIFGSRAMGNFKPGSDVDIALKGDIDHSTVLDVANTLDESDLPYFFDVVDYGSIVKKEFKDHIDNFGKAFYRAC